VAWSTFASQHIWLLKTLFFVSARLWSALLALLTGGRTSCEEMGSGSIPSVMILSGSFIVAIVGFIVILM